MKRAKNWTRQTTKELADGLDPRVLVRQVLINGENRRLCFDFINKILGLFVITNKIQEDLLKKYIFCSWKLRRVRELERVLLNNQQVLDDFELAERGRFVGKNISRRVNDLSKIRLNDEVKEVIAEQDRLERQMTRALKQLREEQRIEKEQATQTLT
jgi:hypothetical protein